MENFAGSPTRRGFAEKDLRGWAEFLKHVHDHSGLGSALMVRGVTCLEPWLFMKRHIPHAVFLALPMTGHTSNIEEPALFNQHVAEFPTSVESGHCGTWKRARR